MRMKTLALSAFLLIATMVGAATYKTLHDFEDVNTGYWPYPGVILDQTGNLYGIASYGGADYVDGLIFKLVPSPGGWTYSVEYEFGLDDPAGQEPLGGLVMDEAGNFYGTNSYSPFPGSDCGTVFKLAPPNTVTVLHSFTGSDGCHPQANLSYSNEWLRGTTPSGGASGQGTVFLISTSGDSFQSYSFEKVEGTTPLGGLNSWNYGTTGAGGTNAVGNVYRLDPVKGLVGNHKFRVDGQAGYAPMGDLLTGYVGSQRAMYGTTSAGGRGNGGAVYQLTEREPNSDRWALKTLHSFTGVDGLNPWAGLSADPAGNLYGTTYNGGEWNCGTVFKLSPRESNRWKFTVVYSFKLDYDEHWDGCGPSSGVVIDAAGNLYGTTLTGGIWDTGTVYEITP